jgi:hypothetical protein
MFQLTSHQLEDFISLLSEEDCETLKNCIPFQPEEHTRLVHRAHSSSENIYRDETDRIAFKPTATRCCNIIPKADLEWLPDAYARLRMELDKSRST